MREKYVMGEIVLGGVWSLGPLCGPLSPVTYLFMYLIHSSLLSEIGAYLGTARFQAKRKRICGWTCFGQTGRSLDLCFDDWHFIHRIGHSFWDWNHVHVGGPSRCRGDHLTAKEDQNQSPRIPDVPPTNAKTHNTRFFFPPTHPPFGVWGRFAAPFRP